MTDTKKQSIQHLVIKMIDGDTEAKNQIINYYSNYIDNLIDKTFKDFECDKDLIREKMLQKLYNCIKNYDSTKANYFSTYLLGYIVTTAKVELRKIKNKQYLKNREIQKVAERMVNGDNNAINQIIEFYTPRIKKLVRDKYSYTNYEEDLIQVGTIGLLKAINLYKQKQEYPFCTYANTYIKKEIEYELISLIKSQNIEYVGLNNNYNSKEFDDFIENAELKEAINMLSDVKKQILFLHIYGNCAFSDIADIFDFSYKRAHQHYKRSIELIKQELNLPNEKQKKL